jgi:signal transduction histidine kinase
MMASRVVEIVSVFSHHRAPLTTIHPYLEWLTLGQTGKQGIPKKIAKNRTIFLSENTLQSNRTIWSDSANLQLYFINLSIAC